MDKNNRQSTPPDETGGGQARPFKLIQVRDVHHRIARMIAEGKRTTEIAAATGMSIDRVSNLRQDPDFGTLIATYRVRLDSGGGLPKNKRQKWTPDTRDDDLDRWALQFAERQRAAEREKRSSPAAAAAPPSSEEPNRTLRRRNTKHPWNKICGEIARLCIDPKTRCVRVPKNETKLADAVLLFCQNTLNCDPPASDMREAVAAICEALRKI